MATKKSGGKVFKRKLESSAISKRVQSLVPEPTVATQLLDKDVYVQPKTSAKFLSLFSPEEIEVTPIRPTATKDRSFVGDGNFRSTWKRVGG